jgi:hypothetical protein
MKLEERCCYVCRSKDIYIFKKVNEFHIIKCRSCKLFWVEGKIEDFTIKAFYNEQYYKSQTNIGYSNYSADEINHRKNARNILKIVQK